MRTIRVYNNENKTVRTHKILGSTDEVLPATLELGVQDDVYGWTGPQRGRFVTVDGIPDRMWWIDCASIRRGEGSVELTVSLDLTERQLVAQ